MNMSRLLSPVSATINADPRRARQRMRRVLHSLLLVAALGAGGCLPGVRQEIGDSIAQARVELHRDPLVLRAEGQPAAEITPDGAFAIAGEPITTDAAQRRALLDYRSAMIAYADAALEVTAEEVGPLTTHATAWALIGVFTGADEWADRRITAESAQLESRIRHLCPQIARAGSAQAELASVLPAFRPYADPALSDSCDG